MRIFYSLIASFLICATAHIPAFSQVSDAQETLQYADLADLSTNAPLIVHVVVKKAIKVDRERVLNAPTGTQRFYIIATTNALIRGQGGVPETIRYIIDLPMDARGRTQKVKKKQFLIFARNASGGNGDVQLVANDAQIAWTAGRDARVRSIVKESVASNAPPAISRIASAFHVPGTILGEGETQIFMETKGDVPVSISILSRDGQRKRWAVSLGEIVDEAAQAPVRNSLLWYRLACFLPRQLPASSLDGDSPGNARRANADYQLVLTDLGNCPRSRR